LQQHGHALRQQQCRQKIALLPFAQRDDARLGGLAFGAAVAGPVVAGTVAVVFAVGFVVLVVVADQVIQR
jgi:hypothetical protein